MDLPREEEDGSGRDGTGRWTLRHRRWLLLVVALVGCAVYLDTLPNGFVLDDQMAIVANRAAHPPLDLSRILKTNYWGSPAAYAHLTIYRPLATLSFALGEIIHGSAPWGYHLVNAVLHGLLSALVVLLGWALFRRRSAIAALAAGLLFAVHPIHTEAVAGAVSRAEILAALFVVATLTLAARASLPGARRYRLWAGAAGTFALGLLSKENAATALLMLPLLDLARHLRARRDGDEAPRPVIAWPLLLACVALLGGYLLLRWAVLPGVLGGDIPALDNPIAHAAGPARWMTPFVVYATAWRLLLWPFGLSVDYTAHAIPLASSWADPLGLLGLVLFLVTIGAAMFGARRHPERALAIALFLAAWSVVSHLAFPGTVIFAERLLYLPSVGLALLAGLGFAWAVSGERRRPLPLAATAAGAAVLLVCAGATIVRNVEWKDERTLYERSAARTPGSSRLQNNLGLQYMEAGLRGRALACYRRAVRIAPENFQAWSNLGQALLTVDALEAAEQAIRQALSRAPGHVPALNNYCHLKLRQGRPREGMGACRTAARLAPDNPVVRTNLLLALFAGGQRGEATVEAEALRDRFPNNPEVQALVQGVLAP